MAARATSSAKSATEDRASGPETAPDIAAEVAALRRELGQLAALVAKLGAADGEAAAQANPADGVEHGDEEAAGTSEKLAGEWKLIKDKVRARFRAHPRRSLRLAALSGLVLGLLLRR